MEFQEYMSTKRRMVNYNLEESCCDIKCADCAFSQIKNGLDCFCVDFEIKYPEKAEEIVKQWKKEHEQKTYAQDFFEKFPKAVRSKYGEPKPCCKDIYGCTKHCSDYNSCIDCWNEPMEDPAHD